MTSLHHSQEEVREMIAAMITTPNKSWANGKNYRNTAFPEIILANMHEPCMNRCVDAVIFIKPPSLPNVSHFRTFQWEIFLLDLLIIASVILFLPVCSLVLFTMGNMNYVKLFLYSFYK